MCAKPASRDWKLRAEAILTYFQVSLPILWHTVQNDLQPLAAGMKRILAEADEI